jgi:hypothetical protein
MTDDDGMSKEEAAEISYAVFEETLSEVLEATGAEDLESLLQSGMVWTIGPEALDDLGLLFQRAAAALTLNGQSCLDDLIGVDSEEDDRDA